MHIAADLIFLLLIMYLPFYSLITPGALSSARQINTGNIIINNTAGIISFLKLLLASF